MKAAAAVLAASLLFFVGVLAGAGRRAAVPAPGAITLGVVQPSSPSGAPGSSPAVTAPRRGQGHEDGAGAGRPDPGVAVEPVGRGRGRESRHHDGRTGRRPGRPRRADRDHGHHRPGRRHDLHGPPGQVQPVDNQVELRPPTGRIGATARPARPPPRDNPPRRPARNRCGQPTLTAGGGCQPATRLTAIAAPAGGGDRPRGGAASRPGSCG